MATARKDAGSERSQPAEHGAKQVKSALEDGLEKGYIGHRPDPHDDEEYSARSGPDSPSAFPQHAGRVEQVHVDAERKD